MRFIFALFLSLIVFANNKGAKADNIDSLMYGLNSSTNSRDSIKALILLSKHFHDNSIDSTFYYGKIAVSQAAKLNDTASLAEVYKNMGTSCYYAALYEKALEYSQKSNELFLAINDMTGLAKTFNNMGIIYEISGKNDIALEYYNKSLEIWHRIIEDSPDDPVVKSSIAYLYNNIGIVYSNIGEKERGKDFYHKSYTIAEKYNDKKCMSLAILNLGNAQYLEGDYKNALENLSRSLKLSEALDDKQGIANSMGSISDVYLKLKNYEKVRYYLKLVLAIAKEIKANELIKNVYRGLYFLNKETGNADTALKYQSLYYQLNDSIYSLESKNRIAELQNKYIFEKKEQEIKLLETEQELKDTQLRNSRIWLLILIGGIVVSLFFLGLIYFQMLQKKYANKELVRKNLEIVKSEEYIRECLKSEQEKKHVIEKQIKVDKYSASTLTEEQKESLKILITETMDNEKPYLDSSFTIDVLSKHLDISRTYISQVINEVFKMNFNNFINEYRIKEARRVLTDEANKNLTIETIALSIGFGSKSSFNSAFKKYTGITPSFYMKSSK